MTLSVIIDKEAWDALEETMQKEYNALDGQEGKYLLDTAPYEEGDERWALEEVSGLRSSLEAARNERDAAKGTAKKFEGVDLSEYQRLTAKKTEIDSWDPGNDDATKQRFEEQNANWQKKYDTDLDAANTKGDTADAKYRLFLKKQVATVAIGKVAGATRVKVLLPHVLPLLGVYPTDDSDVDIVRVKGDEGRPKITQTAGNTGSMTADELVERMKDDKDFIDFFPGTGATGGGATGGGKETGNRGGENQDWSKLSPQERLKVARRQQAAQAAG